MRIYLVASGVTYHLAGQEGVSERVHSSAADFQMSPESSIQVIQRVRANYAMPVDRGLVMQRISFTTTRLFETPAAAQLWSLDYDGAFARGGDVFIDSGAGIRKLSHAVVSPPTRSVVGCTVLLSYTVIGEEITTPPPPEP